MIALTPLVRPETSTGLVLSVVEPFPSWPYWLEPQHLTPPPLVSAQVCQLPAAIAVIWGLTVAGDGAKGGVVAGGDDVRYGVVTGDGLGDDAQAASRSPTTIVVATGNSEGRIPGPPDVV